MDGMQIIWKAVYHGSGVPIYVNSPIFSVVSTDYSPYLGQYLTSFRLINGVANFAMSLPLLASVSLPTSTTYHLTSRLIAPVKSMLRACSSRLIISTRNPTLRYVYSISFKPIIDSSVTRKPKAGLLRGDLIVHTLAAYFQQIQGSINPPELYKLKDVHEDPVGAIGLAAASVRINTECKLS